MPKTRRFLADFLCSFDCFPELWPAADQNVGMACFVNKTPFYHQKPFFTIKNDVFNKKNQNIQIIVGLVQKWM
jgi:hypothetical protein